MVNFVVVLSFVRRRSILPFALKSVFLHVHLGLLVYLACLAHVLLLVSSGLTIYCIAASLFCSWRKDVMDDEIMNTTLLNIEEVADRQVYRLVVGEAPRKDQDVFLDWQLC